MISLKFDFNTHINTQDANIYINTLDARTNIMTDSTKKGNKVPRYVIANWKESFHQAWFTN